MSQLIQRVALLGGYGNFGKRIAENLCELTGLEIWIIGRSLSKAKDLCSRLSSNQSTKVYAMGVDSDAADFTDNLIKLSPQLLINCVGPFQNRQPLVALACLAAKCHYLDLADDRNFVCGIGQFDEQAKAHGLTLISGASSVPGISSCVVYHYASRFAILQSLDIAIAPGNKAERGIATLRGILSYTGKAYLVWRERQWQTVFGWMDARCIDFGDIVGKRWLANVDVPDLTLFPQQFSSLDKVTFQAGLELPLLHHTMRSMAWCSKFGIVKNWSRYTRIIYLLSQWFQKFGSDLGAMRVQLQGVDPQGQKLDIGWTLIAPDGEGPYIPTFSSIILARKLIHGGTVPPGARACVNEFTLAVLNQLMEKHGIYWREEVTNV